MTETRHKHALPKEEWTEFRPRVPAPPPRRKAEPDRRLPGRGRAGFAVVAVVVVGAVIRVLAGGSDDPAGSSGTPGVVAAGTGIDWIAEDGSAYRMTVLPSVLAEDTASPSGCVTVPSPGTTNLRFVVEVENRTPTPAEVPELEFAANVTSSGAVAPEPLAFAEASRRIELTPVVGARSCEESSEVGPMGRARIGSGAAVTFTGILAGVRTPVAEGLTLIIRYAEADASAGSGTSTTVVRVPLTVP